MMGVYSFVGSLIGGALGGSAFSLLLVTILKERWIERVKAGYATELERVKDSLQRDQKALQARLDHGTHVTQAQYDLELSSYKDLWNAMSELRERWRGLFAPYGFQAPGKDNAWLEPAVEQAVKEVFAAHDAAVFVSGRLAPFYEKGIQTAARETTVASHSFLLKYAEWSSGQSEPTSEEIGTRLNGIIEGIETIDTLIRDRLTSLRLI